MILISHYTNIIYGSKLSEQVTLPADSSPYSLSLKDLNIIPAI
jgi:hypothetical protein